MKKKGFVLLLVFVSFILFSCQKDEGDTSVKVSLKMKTTTTNLTKTPGTLTFTSGTVKIREIVFDGENVTTGSSVSITHEQIATIDLKTGESTPEINVVIPAGEYKWVNLGVEIYDEVDAPSVIAEGFYIDSTGNEVPVRFEFNSGEVFEAESSSFTFVEGSQALGFIDFSPAVWFSTVPKSMLDNAERVNGVILINESVNTDIFDIVAARLDDATQAEFSY